MVLIPRNIQHKDKLIKPKTGDGKPFKWDCVCHSLIMDPQLTPPMLCKLVARLPAGDDWIYEIKWDGYRALASKHADRVQLVSRNFKSFEKKFPTILAEIHQLKCKSAVIDGEIVGFDSAGKVSFQTLQNRASRDMTLVYYVFDLLELNGKDLNGAKLEYRRNQLQKILPGNRTSLRFSGSLNGDPETLLEEARKAGLEGIIAKRKNSPYEPNDRSGSWLKCKVDQESEFLVGGYIPGSSYFDSLIVGEKDEQGLRYVARVKNGFVPRTRAAVMKELKSLKTENCPFYNLPEAKGSRYGESLTKEEMRRCRWVKPMLTVGIGYVEKTEAGHLRHAQFVSI